MAKVTGKIPAQMKVMAWQGEDTPLPIALMHAAVPQPKKGEVLVKVAYAGVNRAEVFQRMKQYPLPTKTPCVPGIEFSGEIVKLGSAAGKWKIGNKVCGIIAEGGYAEYVICPVGLLLPVPQGRTLEEAACWPEGLITAWVSLVEQAKLKKGESVLIHGGGSGVGVMAIQLARLLGAKVFITASNDIKCGRCKKLGAHHVINYKTQDFEAEIMRITKGQGIDVVFDMVGGEEYTQKHISLLKLYGRLTLVSFLRGAKMNLNLGPVLIKKLSIHGSILRNRPLAEKAAFTRALEKTAWKAIKSGKIKAVVDSVFALEDAKKAHDKMQESLNFGKILLQVSQ